MARYDCTIHHAPGKHLYVADTLSQAQVAGDDDDSLQEEVEAFVNGVVYSLPASYKFAQEQDPICQQIMEYC